MHKTVEGVHVVTDYEKQMGLIRIMMLNARIAGGLLPWLSTTSLAFSHLSTER